MKMHSEYNKIKFKFLSLPKIMIREGFYRYSAEAFIQIFNSFFFLCAWEKKLGNIDEESRSSKT